MKTTTETKGQKIIVKSEGGVADHVALRRAVSAWPDVKRVSSRGDIISVVFSVGSPVSAREWAEQASRL